MVHAAVRAQPNGEILEEIRTADRASSSKHQASDHSGDEHQAPSFKLQASQYGQIKMIELKP